jgi:hypothetical protein
MEQIQWLRKHTSTWPDTVVSEFSIPLEESRRAGLPQGLAGMSPSFWTITPLYSPVYLYFKVDAPDGFPQRHEILSHGYLRDYGLEIIPGGLEAVGSPMMDTLDEFRRSWNSSNTIPAFIVTDIEQVLGEKKPYILPCMLDGIKKLQGRVITWNRFASSVSIT